MTGPDCIAWGLGVRSAIPLPGALPCAAQDGAVDLTIVCGSQPLEDPQPAIGAYRLGRGAFEFTMPGVARYLCLADHIVVDPAPGADREAIAAMLIATAIPAWLWSRGEIVLHAAAAILPGTTRAVAVLGTSGSGKSTLLARAAAAGAVLIADDAVYLRVTPEGIRASGLPGGYFAPLTGNGTRPFHVVPKTQQCRDAAIGALVVLGAAQSGRLTGAAAVAALLVHRHRPRIAQLMGIEAAGFQRIVEVARDLPVYGHARQAA